MGCSAEFVCITCKKRYYCGYGPYRGLHERLQRAPIQEHARHNTTQVTGDYSSVDAEGNLCLDTECGTEIFIPHYAEFEQIDVA